MHWTSYLTYYHKEVSHMPDWMQREHRARIILNGYIYPQAREMVSNEGELELIIDRKTPDAHTMATRDSHDKIRCESPIMMWSRLTDLAQDTIGIHPTKDQIEQLIRRCREMLDAHDDLDYRTEQELKLTIDKLGLLASHWDRLDASLVRFYPPSKAARFARYDI